MRASIAYIVRPALHRALEQLSGLTPKQLGDLGQTARALLEAAWVAEPRDHRLIGSGIDAVARTFATAPAESEALLRRVIDPDRIKSHGYEEVPQLARQLELLFEVAPDFCADVYSATFTYEETSDETTVMTSGVLGLTSNRSQDYRGAQYHLGQIYDRFLRTAPKPAVRALIATRVAYSLQRTHGRLPDAKPERIVREGCADAVFRPDGSGVWDDQVFAHDDAVVMLNAFEQRLEELATTDDKACVSLARLVFGLEAPAALWRRILVVAARHPDVLGPEVGPLLASSKMFTSYDLSETAIDFCSTAYGKLHEALRAAIEAAVLAIPDTPGLDAHQIEIAVRQRDRVLGQLPEDAIVSTGARELYTARDDVERTPAEPDAGLGGWSTSTYGDREYLADAGVDVDADENRRVAAAVSPVDAFGTEHLNDTPTVEQAHQIAPALRTLRDAIETSGAHKLQSDVAWGHLTRAARTILRQRDLPCDDETLQLATQVLLSASTHERPHARAEDPAAFDENMAIGGGPRADAAGGLILFASRLDCEHREALAALGALAQDPAPSVRFYLARGVHSLHSSEPDAMWSLIEVLANDESTAVRDALVTSAHHLLGVERARVVALVVGIHNAIDDEAAGAAALRTSCVTSLTDAVVSFDDEAATAVLDDLISRLPQFAELAGRCIVFPLRRAVTVGVVSEPDGHLNGVRSRAIALIDRVLGSAIDALRNVVDGQPARMDDWREEAVAEWKALMQLVDGVGSELRFASGAYEASQAQGGVQRPTPEQERFYTEFGAIFDALETIGAPAIAHHLLETLEFFIDVDPRGVFMRIARTLKTGAAFGYQYDTLAEPLFVRLVERYIAEHRTLLQQDVDCRRELVDVLDIFVDAGWPSATRITYGLSDIYR